MSEMTKSRCRHPTGYGERAIEDVEAYPKTVSGAIKKLSKVKSNGNK